jgi:hypothetical protein
VHFTIQYLSLFSMGANKYEWKYNIKLRCLTTYIFGRLCHNWQAHFNSWSLVYFRIAFLLVCVDHWNCDYVLTSSLQYLGMFFHTKTNVLFIHSAESNILSIVTQPAEYVGGATSRKSSNNKLNSNNTIPRNT